MLAERKLFRHALYMKPLADNNRARFDYEILETMEAGIQLAGYEVKSVKAGRMGLNGSYAVMQAGELWLLNGQIPPYQANNAPEDYKPTRSRRLLLHKSELAKLQGLIKQKGTTLVPLETYLNHGLIKIKIGVCKSRKNHDKREYIKERDDRRQMRDRE